MKKICILLLFAFSTTTVNSGASIPHTIEYEDPINVDTIVTKTVKLDSILTVLKIKRDEKQKHH